MSLTSPETLLGGAVLDHERGEVRAADGTMTTLRPKTLDLLRLLVRREGHVVPRAEILDAVWPDVHVTDDSITQCIVELRRALGPDAGLLRTIPKRGYLLDLPAGPGPVAARLPAAPAGTAPVLAVMPFRQVTPDPALAILGFGVLEGVVGALATLREPVVISASTTLAMGGEAIDPRSIGARLGAGYVASGTLRRAGPSLRLTVELADARSAAVLWQRPFDITAGEEFAAQDRIAAVIAHTLAPRVQEAEFARMRRLPPSDIGAYHLLIEARRLIAAMRREAFEQAGALLQDAARLDPGFAPTQTDIAAWYSLRLGQGWSADRPADARALEAALDAALALDSANPRALAMRGHNEAILHRRYGEARMLFDRALEAAPNDAETLLWSSPCYSWTGDGREGVRRAERAMALSPDDPLAFRFAHFRSIGHYVQDEFEEAAAWGLRSWAANPNYVSNLRFTAAALAALGRGAEAAPLVRRAMEVEPEFRVAQIVQRHAFRDPAARERYGQRLVEAGLPA
jgi:adenylate cyclase